MDKPIKIYTTLPEKILHNPDYQSITVRKNKHYKESIINETASGIIEVAK